MVVWVHRNGPRGVKDVNQRVIYQLEARAVVSAGAQAYPGRPLTVARNDAALGLFNGGVVVVILGRSASNLLESVFLDANNHWPILKPMPCIVPVTATSRPVRSI